MCINVRLKDDLFLLRHPFYQAWVEGRLSKSALQDYARQYYHHVGAFPQYLQNALTLCEEGETQNILKENLSEEDGTAFGTSHPQLWLDFANGMGVPTDDVKTASLRPGIRNVVDTFTRHSHMSLAQALGSLYAYESQVPEIAQSKIDGLREHFGVNDEKTLRFFEVHKTADVDHRESLKKIIDGFSPAQKAEAQEAADSSCQALWNFLSDVYVQNHCA